jgi:hypothetical protein
MESIHIIREPLMKFFIATIISLSAFAAHSADLKTTVSEIEFERNAVCSRTGGSFLNLCSGSVPRNGEPSVSYTCTYTAKYRCISNSSDFRLILRVREAYNPRTYVRESKVTRVTYKN